MDHQLVASGLIDYPDSVQFGWSNASVVKWQEGYVETLIYLAHFYDFSMSGSGTVDFCNL